MSDRITQVGPKIGDTSATPLVLWGRLRRREAIAQYREYYQEQLEEAQQALSVPDSQLRVITALGPYAMRNAQEVTE